MAAITVYADVILRNSVLTSGVQGRNIRQNRRVELVSGFKQVNSQWEQTLREYDWETIPLQRSDWNYLESLHEVTDGGAFGFLMEDPKDMKASITEGVVAGLTSTTFQLYKRYTHASRTKDRKITRPRTTDLIVEISGIPTVSYTLDTTTGIITIPAAPSAANVTWSGRFYVPVHFKNDAIDWSLIAGGAEDARYMAGPSVILQEIRE
jgi:uncharacterized protein (TIGR02217 family)